MRSNKLFLILVALLSFAQTAWAQWSGTGTQDDPYKITSTADWNTQPSTLHLAFM